MSQVREQVRKAVVLAAGLGTRFLPLSKVVGKELWPVVDKPMIHWIFQEIKAAGINQVVLVLSSKSSPTLGYFKKDLKLEKALEKKKSQSILAEMKKMADFYQELTISCVVQEKPLGNGDALLRAKSKIGKEPFVLLFCDDIVESKTSCIVQLLNVFKTSQRPVVALYRVAREEVSAWGVVEVEKIARRFFKIKKVVEKPSIDKAPSNLVIVGKYVLTPEIFDYLEAQKKQTKGKEIMLSNALEALLNDGKVVYGYEIEGKWLMCGDKLKWLKTHLYLSLKDPRFGEELKRYLREIM